MLRIRVLETHTTARARKPPAMNLISSRAPVRSTAREREERRIRILAMLRSGFSYEAIALEHQLTSTRIRQIVAASLQTANSTTRVDRMRVQAARLESALRIATRGVETRKLSAIGPLLKALDRLDKYFAVADAPRPHDGAARERLLAKLDRSAARPGIGAENGASRRRAQTASANAEAELLLLAKP
jgi:hypothetical protein